MDDYLFHVTEPKKGQFVIEWASMVHSGILKEDVVKQYGVLSAFLYWAEMYGAAYRLANPVLVHGRRFARRPTIEIISVSGTHGEYKDRLYGGERAIYREFHGTHYLAQHGLDGLPKEYVEKLSRTEEPLFRVEPYKPQGGGVFVMTFWDWMNYFSRGRNENALADMSSWSSVTPVQGEQTHMEL